MKSICVFLLAWALSINMAQGGELKDSCGKRNSDPIHVQICATPELLQLATDVEAQLWQALSGAKDREAYRAIDNVKVKLKQKFLPCTYNGWNAVATCLFPEFQLVSQILQDKYGAHPESNADRASLLSEAKKTITKILAVQEQQLLLCRKNAVLRLDDGISPAADIAKGVSNECQQLALAYVLESNSHRSGEIYYLDGAHSPNLEFALVEVSNLYGPDASINYVLELRATKRELNKKLRKPASASKKIDI